MKIVVHSISHEARRGEQFSPNSSDVYRAQNLIERYLLKNGYFQGVGSIKVNPQGFGHGAPTIHNPYRRRQTLVDTYVYFVSERDSNVLDVSFAISPEHLEGIVFDIMEKSGLPLKGWNCQDFGLFNLPPDFEMIYVSVKEIKDRIQRQKDTEDTKVVRH